MNPGQPVRLWIPYSVLVVALALTAACTYYVAVTSETQDQLRFQSAVMQTNAAIRGRLDAYIASLRSLNAFFATDRSVSREEFSAFVRELQTRRRYPGMRGLGYSVRIAPDRIDSLTAAMRGIGVDSFHIWPAGPRPEYTAIVYLEPIDNANRIALGYDMTTDSARRMAMEMARDSGDAFASGLVSLVIVPGQQRQRGFLIYYPIYRDGARPSTVEERRRLLAGYIYAGFRAREVLNGVFTAETQPRVDFRIYDSRDTAASHLIFNSLAADSSAPSNDKPHYMRAERINMAGRLWTIVYTSRPEFDLVSGAWTVPYIFLGGLAVSFILYWLSRAQARARMAAERSATDLKRSEERYRSIIETAPDVIFTVSAEGAITSLSPAFEKLSGWPIAEWIDQPFAPIIHPDDLPNAFLYFQQVLAGETPAPYELRVVTRSGDYLDVEFRTKPHYDGDAIIGGIGVARDITERRRGERALRESEARYRAFVEHSSEAIWRFELEEPVPADLDIDEQIDHFYRFAYLAECNDVMARMYGYREAGDIVGARLGDMLIRTNPDNVAYLRAFIESGYRLVDAESVEQDRDGNTKYFANNLMGIVENGVLARAWGIQRDITERRRAEAEVREAKEAAEAANHAKDQFLAVLSHELRTPLTPVLTALQLLREEETLAEESRLLVEMIDRNVGLEARLIDDLLDLTRIANGKLELHPEPVDIHALVHASVDISHEEIASRGLDVRVELGAERHWVQGDPARLQQVLWNLVKNAVKFTPKGGLVAIRSWNDEGRLRVEVTDTGIGISPEILPHIFNAFEQGEKTITRRFGGLGLGLSISKLLVEMHGGEIAARSEGEGKGATFTIALHTITVNHPFSKATSF